MDAPQNLELHVGAAENLRLPGLGSAGYQWLTSVDDGDVVSVQHLARSREASGKPMARGAAQETFRIQGLTKGVMTVHFVQHRIFENDKPPLKQISVHVVRKT